MQINSTPRFGAIIVKPEAFFLDEFQTQKNTFGISLELTGDDVNLSPIAVEKQRRKEPRTTLNLVAKFDPNTKDVQDVFLDVPVQKGQGYNYPLRSRITFRDFRTECNFLLERLMKEVSSSALFSYDTSEAFKGITFEEPKSLNAESRQEWTRVMQFRLIGLLRSTFDSSKYKPQPELTGVRLAETEDNNTQYFVRYAQPDPNYKPEFKFPKVRTPKASAASSQAPGSEG